MDEAPAGPQGWEYYPNLHRRPHAPNAGRGRLQRQIARAFIAHGDVVSATDTYRWCQRWQSSRFGMPERWSIVRILTTRCERVGRASTIGRPVAAQGARGGYHVRPVRLISLEK